MKAFLAAMLLVGLSVAIAEAADKPAPPPKPSTVTPEEDSRLAKRPDAQPKKIGVLSYYANLGGGYTFLERNRISFYSLPLLPKTRQRTDTFAVNENKDGVRVQGTIVVAVKMSTIGDEIVPFGGQTLYRTQMAALAYVDAPKRTAWQRDDIPIATWSRDTPNGTFRLSIITDDRETRLKLKSIVPVLEHAEHAP